MKHLAILFAFSTGLIVGYSGDQEYFTSLHENGTEQPASIMQNELSPFHEANQLMDLSKLAPADIPQGNSEKAYLAVESK